MTRPFAVAGFTVFFTVTLLSDSETGVVMYAFCAYVIALVIALLIKELREGKVIPFSVASGALACVLLVCFNLFVYEPAIAYDGLTSEIKARLTSSPQERYGNVYYQAETISVNGVDTDLKIRLGFNQKIDVQPYDVIEGNFTFYKPGYTSEEYLQSNKANGNYIAAYSVGDINVLNADEEDKPFAYKLEMFRKEIKDAVYKVMPDSNGALLIALLLGDKSGIDDVTLNDFNKAGIMHIICVSGFHLSLWAGFVLGVLRKLGIGTKLSSVVAMFCVVFFMLVAGLSASVLRSGIMMLVYLAANIFSRKSDSLNSLGFSLLVLAIYNPMILTGLGLKLSALSTLGIILYNEYFSEKVEGFFVKLKNKYLSSFLAKTVGSLAVTASAVAFIQPITLQMQGNFNFLVFFSNLLVSFAAGACMVTGAIAAFLSGILPLDFNLFAYISRAFSEYILFIAKEFSDWSFLTFYVEETTALFIIAIVFLISSIAVYCSFWRKINPVVPIVICTVFFVSSVVASSVKLYNEPRFNVLDVGNATAVGFSYKGKRILFGCGGSLFDSQKEIFDYIHKTCGKLDALILPDNSDMTSKYAVDIVKNYSPSIIQSDGLSDNVKLVASADSVLSLEQPIVFDSFEIINIKVDNKYCSYIKTPDVSALVFYHPVADFSSIPSEYSSPDIIITRSDYPIGVEKTDADIVAVNAENLRGVLIQDELIAKGVNSCATAECGDITIAASHDKIDCYRS